MNTEQLIQTKQEVLKNTSAIPQKFLLTNNGLNTVVHGSGAKGNIVNGAIVSDKEKPGSFGFVATPHTKESVQRMISTIFSDNMPSKTRTFDFVLPPKSLENRTGELCLRVYPENGNFSLDEDRPLMHDGKGRTNLIPLVVGPGSVAISEDWTPEELKLAGFVEAPEIDWSGLLKGVTSAVPVIAQTGLNIYNQLSKGSESNGKSEKAPEGIFSSIGSVIDTAVPFVAAMI